MKLHCLEKINQISELDVEALFLWWLEVSWGTCIHIISGFFTQPPALPTQDPSVRGIPAGGWVRAQACDAAWQMQGYWGTGIIHSFCLVWSRALRGSPCPGDTLLPVQLWRVLACFFSAIPLLHPCHCVFLCALLHPGHKLDLLCVTTPRLLHLGGRSHLTQLGT